MTSSALAAASDGASPSTRRFVRAALLLFFTYIFLANAWMGDDAHITFRSVWNFVHGYGLTYNPDERVQAFTHPLWFLTVSLVHFVTREFFFSVTVLSWALDIAAGMVVLRRARSLASATLVVAWLVSSKALIDYTSSGLEYPLSYFLIALFYARYFDRKTHRPPTLADLRFFTLIAALSFVNRSDTSLLFVVPLVEMTIRAFAAHGRATIHPLIVGSLPAILWLAFATFYYGFPLPNTYYAKVANGIPGWLERQQGLAYFFNSISHDPITLGTIALALLFAWRSPGPGKRATVSALLYVLYTINVGGDFMSGRFFAMPFLIAVIAMVPDLELSLVPWAGGALVLYNLVVPIVPIKTTATYDGAWPWRTQNGIKDERGFTHKESNVLMYAPFRSLPDTPFSREGISFGGSDRHASVYCCIGLYGLNAGPTKHVIDDNALSDPLLARLPVSPRVFFDFWASHYFRDLPEGYVESNEQNQNLLTDPLLRPYYDKLRHVTRGRLTDWSRLRDIWALNVEYRHLQRDYDKRRPIALSIPANHFRFQTDVGFRDDRQSVISTTGREGYLQYGPGIPLSPRFYRARWIGTVSAAPTGEIGYVELIADGVQLNRQPVRFEGAGPHKTLAQIDFSLKKPARHVDYRLFVRADAVLSLERVELFSGTAIPADN